MDNSSRYFNAGRKGFTYAFQILQNGHLDQTDELPDPSRRPALRKTLKLTITVQQFQLA